MYTIYSGRCRQGHTYRTRFAWRERMWWEKHDHHNGRLGQMMSRMTKRGQQSD